MPVLECKGINTVQEDTQTTPIQNLNEDHQTVKQEEEEEEDLQTLGQESQEEQQSSHFLPFFIAYPQPPTIIRHRCKRQEMGMCSKITLFFINLALLALFTPVLFRTGAKIADIVFN